MDPRRKSLLERRVPLGRGTRPIAANIDTVFVVTANRDPAPVPQLIDRLLVVAESNEIAAAVVINKMDLDPGTALEARFRQAGYPVFRTSAKTGEGLEALRAAMAGRESVVTGPSGAGKSSLLNALHPGLGLRTGELSRKVRRGRNTTVSALMLPFEGGYLVDTPGFNEVGTLGDRAAGAGQLLPGIPAVPRRVPLPGLPAPDRTWVPRASGRRRGRHRARPPGELPDAAGGDGRGAGGVGVG